ncbi:methyl-accepting chemotaxis protein [Lyngbya sp. CCY1209]|uniref:HAMP domain-containing methyl-accepting chemotaxis protein n=1 Tax=Lyngbya sp. CCY1209 TaxID=2886103 RepID=UPI002D20D45B|nr:methyl-accepting chemotaxis protein [Lyngbya sp. CCY1209]MEB3883291.1 methyl-accepting chemotaxis protein [Lyngbya sp. CCY1209]
MMKKLSTKLYCGFFLIPAAVLVIVSGYSVFSFWRIDSRIGTIYDDRVVPLQQLKTISDAYAVLVIDAVNKADAGIISTDAALNSINAALVEIEQNWDAYLGTDLTPQEKALATDIERLFAPAQIQIERLRQALQAGNSDQLAAFDGALYDVIDPLTDKIQDLINLQLQVAELERQRARAVLNETLLLFGLLVLAAVVVASPFGYFLSQSVANTFKQTIKAISDSSNEIAVATEEHERVATQQAAAVSETTSTMDELGASSTAATEQADAALTGAKQALSLSESGQQAVDSTLDGMGALQDKVDAIARQIVRLSEQTNQIGNISQLVADLANQTNMLALNAAVEAVRAGEHGRGFGVVATEIRKLADESQKSAQKIGTLVADIQTAINSTVMVTEEGTKTVRSGVDMAQKTAAAFSGVTDAVNEVVINNQQISLNIKQQALAISQVLEAMTALKQGATETANGIGQTKSGMQQLKAIAAELQSII